MITRRASLLLSVAAPLSLRALGQLGATNDGERRLVQLEAKHSGRQGVASFNLDTNHRIVYRLEKRLDYSFDRCIRHGYTALAVSQINPLTPAVFHVLLALAGGKRHGYDIAKEIKKQSNGQVNMGPGTLYGTLQRLLDQGWIVVSDSPEGVDERRRYYRLNHIGKTALQGEVERMEALVRTARSAHVRLKQSKA